MAAQQGLVPAVVGRLFERIENERIGNEGIENEGQRIELDREMGLV